MLSDREGNGDGDPRQHAEQRDPEERRDRERAFGSPLLPEPDRAGHVGE